MKKSNLYFYILVIISFFVLAYLLTPIWFQNDTFYTIKIGESISKHGVDMVDHFSFIPNLAYVYPHWLYDLFIYFIYSLGGYSFIYFSTIILAFILLTSLFVFSVKLGNNKYISYLLIVFFGFFLKGYFTARAQMFSYILFGVILYSIEMLRKTNKKRYFIYLFLSSLLIANMHSAVWLFIFVLFLPYIAQDLIYLIKNKFKWKFFNLINVEIEKSKLKITFIAFLLCLMTGFMTPNFLVPFTYYIKTAMGNSMNTISEHGPSTIKYTPQLYLLFIGFVLLLLNKKIKIKLSDLFLILGLFIVAFSSIKNISLFYILTIYSFSRIINMLDFSSIEPLLWNKWFITVMLVLFLSFLGIFVASSKTKQYINKRNYPVDACDYIIENLDYKNIRIFNQYDFGSYLMLRGIPVFIDSRADLYLKEFNKDCDVFEDYIENKYEYKENAKKYNITHFLLKNNTNLNYIIKNSKDYKVVYKDDYFTLYSVGD